MDNEISGENLAIVGVTAKIEVNTGGSCFIQFFWLVVNKNNWFALVQRLCKLGRSLPGTFYFLTAGSIPASDYVKLIINQYRFII
jgi:hypothetical protein